MKMQTLILILTCSVLTQASPQKSEIKLDCDKPGFADSIKEKIDELRSLKIAQAKASEKQDETKTPAQAQRTISQIDDQLAELLNKRNDCVYRDTKSE